ncbi:MAG: SAM-dependent methyltransferase [Clostridiales bacterium]|nr:SAM-dependent methyltransferase [Clostridiales bacterium]
MIDLDLTPRLKTIAQSIKRCNTVVDIGSDHAYLPIYLIRTGKAQTAIATDVNEGPAEIAMRRIKKFGLDELINVRIGNGLSVIDKDEADVIVIAGMGGILIKDILEAGIEIAKNARQIILQPMRDSRILIKWLIENSFEILRGEVVKEDNKFYEIIWTQFREGYTFQSSVANNEVYYYKNNNTLHEYIDKKINEYKKIISQIKATNEDDNQIRLKECIEELNGYREAKQWHSLNVEQ